MHHRHLLSGRFVSALEPRFSPCVLADAATLLVGGVSSSLSRRGSKATHRLASPMYSVRLYANKNYGNLIALTWNCASKAHYPQEEEDGVALNSQSYHCPTGIDSGVRNLFKNQKATVDGRV